jgi:hypothetical protein
MATRNRAIADAFVARVVVYASYRDKWITDCDFVRIIAFGERFFLGNRGALYT